MKSYNHPNNQLALEEQIRQVKSKYASHVQSCIQVTKHEAEGYRDLLHRSTADIVGKYIPAAANDRPGVASMWASEESHLKLTEAAKKYPNFWSGFKTLQNKFTVESYNKTHEAYAQSIRATKSLREADWLADKLQEWHNSLIKDFHLDLNNMLQKFEMQLKDVCQPHVCQQHAMPDNHQPFGVPLENAQHNQPDNEVERLMKMIEDMQSRLNQREEESRHKDGIIEQKNTQLQDFREANTDLRNQLHDSREANADLRDSNTHLRTERAELREQVADLTQEVTQRDTTINELNQELGNEHVKYDLLKIDYDGLVAQHNVCLANNHNPFNESSDFSHMSQQMSAMGAGANESQNDF